MPSQSRTQKTILNAKVNAICWGVSILIAFFSRKILLQHLGDEFMGLSGMLGSILGYLNITEFGIGTVIGVVLFRPLFLDDKDKIREIVSVLGYLYRCVGIIILSIGFVISLFIPVIFNDTEIDIFTIYVGFYAGLFSSLLGYFVNYRSVLLSADQRNYEVTGYFQLSNTLKSILQMILAVYLKSFMLFFLIEFVFGIVYACILNIRINKIYPWLHTDIKKGRILLSQYPEITQKVKQTFFHNIGALVQNQTIPIVIYWFISLPMIALYANYSMISNQVRGLGAAILNSTSSGVGNLIAEGDKEKILKTYRELFVFRFFTSGVFSFAIYFLISDFIYLWLGEEYVLSPMVVIVLTATLFLNLLRDVTDQFINGYGLFQDVWSPFVESVILISASILGGAFFGLPGLLSGPLLAIALVIYVWKPYFLFTRGFKMSLWHYTNIFSRHILSLALSFVAILLVIKMISWDEMTWGLWLCKVALVGVMSISLLFCTLSLMSTDMRSFARRFLQYFWEK